MEQHCRDRRKIVPARGATLGDGSPDDDGRVGAGPTAPVRAERRAAGLREPDLAAVRAFRRRRPTAHAAARGLDALATLDIRYATDATDMQIRNAHDPFRACRLCADGPWFSGSTAT